MGSRPSLKHLVEAYERHIIEDALQAASGNQRRAARALGVLPTTLHEKMKRLGLLRRADAESDLAAPMALAG
ncbi:MAG TPA: helix-turn-helix domain-containing protein [Vicinamibacteria bacterium]|nr:helix-turn-helix domain-containing protein [Vicinamibacteria bacterium]